MEPGENEDFLLNAAPPSFYYIPDFISEAEEANLMRHIEQSPGPRWGYLKDANIFRGNVNFQYSLKSISNNWEDKIVTSFSQTDGHSWQIGGCRTGVVFLTQRACWQVAWTFVLQVAAVNIFILAESLPPWLLPLVDRVSCVQVRTEDNDKSQQQWVDQERSLKLSTNNKDLHIREGSKPRAGEWVSARTGNNAPHRWTTLSPYHRYGKLQNGESEQRALCFDCFQVTLGSHSVLRLYSPLEEDSVALPWEQREVAAVLVCTLFTLKDIKDLFKGEAPESGGVERSVLQLLAAWHPGGEGGPYGQQHRQPDGGGEGAERDGQEYQNLPHN